VNCQISPDRGQADRKPQTAHFDHPLFYHCGEQLLRIVLNGTSLIL
jgi:hypothetical protein